MIGEPIERVILTPLDGQACTISAAIEGTAGNGVLRLQLAQPLLAGTMVRIAAGANYSTTGKVLQSISDGASHRATIGIQQNERRREARIQVTESAHLTSLHSHTPVNCDALVSDVSRAGVGLVTRVQVPRDLLVKIELDAAIVFGEVRHCSARVKEPDTFMVGVEIQTVIFRDDGRANWLLSPKVLWATLNVGFQNIAGRVRKGQRPQ